MDYSYETSKGTITTIVVLVGDVNFDGCVNIADADYIAEYVAQSHGDNGPKLTEFQQLAGDVNNDGKVDIRDAAEIARYLDSDRPHL